MSRAVISNSVWFSLIHFRESLTYKTQDKKKLLVKNSSAVKFVSILVNLPTLSTEKTASSCPRKFSAIHLKKYPDFAGGRNKLLILEGTFSDGSITWRGTRRHFLASGLHPELQILIGCWYHLKWGTGWPRSAVVWIVVASPKDNTRRSV